MLSITLSASRAYVSFSTDKKNAELTVLEQFSKGYIFPCSGSLTYMQARTDLCNTGNPPLAKSNPFMFTGRSTRLHSGTIGPCSWII
jgi:hypothetical protein